VGRIDLPTISIVTPSLNQGRFVRATVRSVFLQRYPRLEYIFMDGGSTDDTLGQVEPYRGRFAHFESGPDGGQSEALAKGFSLSTGDVMAYLNSDDVLLPGTLTFVAQYFAQHREVDFLYSHRCVLDEGGSVVGHWILPRHSNSLMRRWDLIPQETCFWRRDLFERAGNVDPSLYFAMDYDLFLRFMACGRGVRVGRFLAGFRVHGSSKTAVALRDVGAPEIEAVQRKHGLRAPRTLGFMFSAWVQFRSARWARRGEAIPGLPPGSGFSLEDVWGGLL
jgi:glycosyltransferase involved in cell wall biosynthesis